MSNASELAERALGNVTGGDQALATVAHERSLLLRFARSRPTQATAVDDATISISVVVDGHVGGASTNRDDDDSLRECAKAAVAAAEAAARTRGRGSYPGFPGDAASGGPGAGAGFDPDTASMDPASGGDALATAFAVAAEHGVEVHGVWSTGDVETAIVSSTGIAVGERLTDAFMKTTCIAADGRSGWANQASVRAADLDPTALATQAASRATAAFAERRDVVRLEPGEYQVVLAPAAVGEMLDWMGWAAFNGLAHVEGRGAFVGKIGTRVAAPSINVSDSPNSPRTLPRSFDAEGVAKRPIPLIQDGVAMNVVHDTRSAAMAGGGAHTTGHAAAPGGSTWGAFPTNLVMVGGGATDETELCSPIERGVYVTRLWYTNVVRPNEVLITGVTRDGTFLIEDGKIAAPVEDLRLTDSVLSVLAHTEALTAGHQLWSEGEFYGRRYAAGSVVPAIRSRLRFSG